MSEEWKELLKNNRRIQEKILRIDSGKEMKMMAPYLEAMTIVSAANCLKPSFAPLFLSLAFIEVGIDSEKSPAGFFGPSVNRLVDKITEAMTSEALFGKTPSLAAPMVLKKIIKLLFILAIAGGKFLKEKIGEKEKEKEVNTLYVKLFFKLSSVTDIFKTALKELISAVDPKENCIETIAKSLSSIAFLLMANSAVTKQNFNSVIEILSPYFEDAIKIAEKNLENEESEIKAHLTSFKLSLENQNFEDFLRAVFAALEAVGISQNGFTEDVKSIEEMALRVKKAISQGLVDFAKNTTEISVVV